jgi:hypothetical protein
MTDESNYANNYVTQVTNFKKSKYKVDHDVPYLRMTVAKWAEEKFCLVHECGNGDSFTFLSKDKKEIDRLRVSLQNEGYLHNPKFKVRTHWIKNKLTGELEGMRFWRFDK